MTDETLKPGPHAIQAVRVALMDCHDDDCASYDESICDCRVAFLLSTFDALVNTRPETEAREPVACTFCGAKPNEEHSSMCGLYPCATRTTEAAEPVAYRIRRRGSEQWTYVNGPLAEGEDIELSECEFYCDLLYTTPPDDEARRLDDLAARVSAMCKARGWSMHWTHRGAYLHLEASEFIEALRGKGEPVPEAGDVMLVFLSILHEWGISFGEVLTALTAKLEHLEGAPRYEGEETDHGNETYLAQTDAEKKE